MYMYDEHVYGESEFKKNPTVNSCEFVTENWISSAFRAGMHGTKQHYVHVPQQGQYMA